MSLTLGLRQLSNAARQTTAFSHASQLSSLCSGNPAGGWPSADRQIESLEHQDEGT